MCWGHAPRVLRLKATQWFPTQAMCWGHRHRTLDCLAHHLQESKHEFWSGSFSTQGPSSDLSRPSGIYWVYVEWILIYFIPGVNEEDSLSLISNKNTWRKEVISKMRNVIFPQREVQEVDIWACLAVETQVGFFVRSIYKFLIYVYVCLLSYGCRCPWMPDEDIGSSGARAKSSCELLDVDMGAGIQIQVFCKSRKCS